MEDNKGESLGFIRSAQCCINPHGDEEGDMGRKDCYGFLDKVFPAGAGGMREVPPLCRECAERLECLKAALSTGEGIELRARAAERSGEKGIMGKLQRWSLKKELSRTKEERKKSR